MQEQGLAAHLGLLGGKETSKAAQAPSCSVSQQGTHTKVLPTTDPVVTGCCPVLPVWVSDCLSGKAFVSPGLGLGRASSGEAVWSPWAECMLSLLRLMKEKDMCWSTGAWRLAQLTMPFVFCFAGL